MRRDPLPPDALDRTDRALVRLLQDGLPFCPDPFRPVAETLCISEQEVIERIAHLRELGAITRFGPFVDAEAMGGAFCLCAMAVPQARFDEVMTLVNAHPEVAHNYERVHHLNMWFVLAAERAEDIARVADRIEAETGLKVLRFPKEKEFFIGFRVNT
jgi:DNA-binding Lrp family transcriptional regulator